MRIATLEGMAYHPRCEIIFDGAAFHVTWQCHNQDWLLKWDWAKQIYYDLLVKYKDRYGVQFHAYSFMDNHPHLIGTLADREQFSRLFQTVHSQFARQVNKRLGRRGQVVMDRFKSPRIKSDEHMLTAMAYVDLNSHRAKKVKHPRKYRWSSYAYYAHGKPDKLITPSPSYLALGRTAAQRQQEYRGIVEAMMFQRRRMNISHTPFIGDPDWVLAQYRELCQRMGRTVTDFMASRITRPPPQASPVSVAAHIR